jgi:hypothetical protein
VVDGQDLTREGGRVAHRDLRHARRNPDAVRRLRHGGEQRPQVESGPRRVHRVDELVPGDCEVETQRLDFAEALQQY